MIKVIVIHFYDLFEIDIYTFLNVKKIENKCKKQSLKDLAINGNYFA